MAIATEFAGHNPTLDDLSKYGGTWDADYSVYQFPDGSMGRFTDLVEGACQRDSNGNPVFHFVEVHP